MCGFVGVLGPLESDRARFSAAVKSIAHRGPDGEATLDLGPILLGYRRLAIIDLSYDADQPMVDPETGVTIIFNGEIYNYLELRSQLEQLGTAFRTRSDTEVLLKAYLRWGADALPRLNGMWALAIWDPREGRLFVSRDRFGVKPFYYASVGGRLIFASEPKAILALEPALAEPNLAALAAFYRASEGHAGAATYYKSIFALPPGGYGVAEAGAATFEVRGYWRYPEPYSARDDGASAETFLETFEDAVRLRFRSDVPVGLTLSGGLDSSAILAASNRLFGPGARCFTSVYGGDERGEEAWAQKAAGLVGAPLQSVEAPLADWHQTLTLAIAHMESPGYSPAIVPQWSIMRAARAAGVPVLLEGQGADELLAGYTHYAPAALAGRPGTAGGALRSAERLVRAFGPVWPALWLLRAALPGAYRLWRGAAGGQSVLAPEVLAQAGVSAPRAGGFDLFGQLRDDHAATILPSLLHYGDAVSMAHGVEGRLPFLDYRLVEWVFAARPDLIVDGETKVPIRRYLRARGFEAIAARPQKQGYPTPLARWLAGEGGVFLRDRLASANDEAWRFLKPAAVAGQLNRALAGDGAALFQTFKVVTTVLWLEQMQARRLGQAVFTQPPAAHHARPGAPRPKAANAG